MLTGIHTLRRECAVIPQDAVLFSGSVRTNLDPFDDHTDEALWKVWDACGLLL